MMAHSCDFHETFGVESSINVTDKQLSLWGTAVWTSFINKNNNNTLHRVIKKMSSLDIKQKFSKFPVGFKALINLLFIICLILRLIKVQYLSALSFLPQVPIIPCSRGDRSGLLPPQWPFPWWSSSALGTKVWCLVTRHFALWIVCGKNS